MSAFVLFFERSASITQAGGKKPALVYLLCYNTHSYYKACLIVLRIIYPRNNCSTRLTWPWTVLWLVALFPYSPLIGRDWSQRFYVAARGCWRCSLVSRLIFSLSNGLIQAIIPPQPGLNSRMLLLTLVFIAMNHSFILPIIRFLQLGGWWDSLFFAISLTPIILSSL